MLDRVGPGGLGGTSVVAGTRWSFRGKDARTPGPRHSQRGCVGASSVPPAAQSMFRQALRVQRREAHGGTLILGGGFAGSYVARLLGKRGSTIVSRENFMLYTPMLPEAASATLDPR